MAQKAYFDKISVRKETRRMIECLATAYRAKIVDYVEGVMKAEWAKAKERGLVMDSMLDEPEPAVEVVS